MTARYAGASVTLSVVVESSHQPGIRGACEGGKRQPGAEFGFYQFQQRQECPDRIGQLPPQIGPGTAAQALEECIDADRRAHRRAGREGRFGDGAVGPDDPVAALLPPGGETTVICGSDVPLCGWVSRGYDLRRASTTVIWRGHLGPGQAAETVFRRG